MFHKIPCFSHLSLDIIAFINYVMIKTLPNTLIKTAKVQKAQAVLIK